MRDDIAQWLDAAEEIEFNQPRLVRSRRQGDLKDLCSDQDMYPDGKPEYRSIPQYWVDSGQYELARKRERIGELLARGATVAEACQKAEAERVGRLADYYVQQVSR
jgi:hypothetical protein